MDLQYIDNWSLWLDLKIIFRTAKVVLLGGRGGRVKDGGLITEDGGLRTDDG